MLYQRFCSHLGSSHPVTADRGEREGDQIDVTAQERRAARHNREGNGDAHDVGQTTPIRGVYPTRSWAERGQSQNSFPHRRHRSVPQWSRGSLLSQASWKSITPRLRDIRQTAASL